MANFIATTDFTKFTLTRRAKHWQNGIIGILGEAHPAVSASPALALPAS